MVNALIRPGSESKQLNVRARPTSLKRYGVLAKLKRDLSYWLENLEKKFVYNQCFDHYAMSRDEVDEAIVKFGYENITVKFEG